MALSDQQVRAEIQRLVDESLGDFTRRLDVLTAPTEQVINVLAGMGLPDFAEAWDDYLFENAEDRDD